MENSNRVSAEALERLANRANNQARRIDWNGIQIEIRRTIGLEDVMAFASEAMENCFLDSGAFVPEVLDFVIKSNLLTRYTNLDLPQDLKTRYTLIYNTNLVEQVSKYIDKEQMDEITSAIRSKVHYACQRRTAASEQRMMELADAFEDLQTKMEEVFGGLTSGDVQNLVNAVSMGNGKLDEEALVKAFMKQQKEA